MARPLKDTETNRPAVAVTFKLTEPRLEWLKALAERRNESLSGAIELLIDRARGAGDDGEPRIVGTATLPDPTIHITAALPGASFKLADGRTKRLDPKDGVAPIPKKGSAK